MDKIDKEIIFNEFKKTKEITKVPEKIKIKNKHKNNKKLKNKSKEIIPIKTDFDKWKEEFLSNQTNQDFINLLEFYRKSNFNIFSDDEFFKIKYEHKNAKTVILDPSLPEINAGKGGNGFLVKPLYPQEYNYFLKNIGTRDKNPEEFMQYAIETCVLYPKYSKEQLDKTGAGTILALYNYILEFSDLTKTIRVLEV